MVAASEIISRPRSRRRFLRTGLRGFRAGVNDQRSMINNQKNGIPFNLLIVPWPLAIERSAALPHPSNSQLLTSNSWLSNMLAGGKKQYYLDQEIALYLLGSGDNGRYYDATTGRFLSEDPAKQDGTSKDSNSQLLTSNSSADVNLFRYTGNDPVNNLDPSGHSLVTDPPKPVYHPPQTQQGQQHNQPPAQQRSSNARRSAETSIERQVNSAPENYLRGLGESRKPGGPLAGPPPGELHQSDGSHTASKHADATIAKINALAHAGTAKIRALAQAARAKINAMTAKAERQINALTAHFKHRDSTNDLTIAELESANQVEPTRLPRQYMEIDPADSNEGLTGKLAHLPIIGNIIDAAARINTAHMTGASLRTADKRAIALDAASLATLGLGAEADLEGTAVEDIATVGDATSRFSQLRTVAEFLRNEAGVSSPAYRRQIIESFGADLKVGIYQGQAYQYSASGSTSSRYLTPSPLSKPIQELALPPSNPALVLQQYRVTATKALMGSTARQNFGFPLRGGGQQIFVPSRSLLVPTPLLPGH